jgi:hypothetical protein
MSKAKKPTVKAAATAPELADTWGAQGRPRETLAALAQPLKSLNAETTTVVLVTDWQGSRENANYALFAHDKGQTVVSADAFGPRYGATGVAALRELVEGLQNRGAENFKEAILAPHEFNRLLEEPSAAMILRLLAIANPIDVALYV